ncbi:C39 family peptidase [Ureibacillus chungkukjangi]|uniref:Uncharacterized protein YvpB n=1 Tax=Ureibacillus chungkukjangi TaxID=1202712 RepID=A0A318TDH6_9BACL|nr:C39 family peptidase [Ureibacillus chungkukjangi]PYF01857.1 uncharacterized protein YvpB [Ureibacillus chungkukjangi]
MSTKLKGTISLLTFACLLAACSLESEIKTNTLNTTTDTSITNQNENVLTVLTVESSSREPVPNLKITLSDVLTGKEIHSVVSSNEGEAQLNGLEEGKTYLITASISESNYPSVEKLTFKNSNPYHVIIMNSNSNQNIEVPTVMQNPELPNGCEITSLTAVLNYYGLQVTKTDMADNYLPQQNFRFEEGIQFGADPNVAYTGSPYEKRATSYVFAAPIVKAAKSVISDNNLSLQVTNASGQSPHEILNLVKQGVPVVMWVTLDLSEPRKNSGWIIDGTDQYHEMYQNLHAVVLMGYSENKVTIMDPLKGKVEHDKQDFLTSYEELGKQAVAIHK